MPYRPPFKSALTTQELIRLDNWLSKLSKKEREQVIRDSERRVGACIDSYKGAPKGCWDR